jgi:hypothetical protein
MIDYASATLPHSSTGFALIEIGIRKAIRRRLEVNLRKYKEGTGINAKTSE